MNKPIQILDTIVQPGKKAIINLEVAKLHTASPVNIPIIVDHAKKKGPTLLLLGGVHGDEINGIEIVRKIVRSGLNKPQRGTVICIPVLNIFGFLNFMRELPDGRDLNRSFPGTASGSLASQFAYAFMKHIAPLADIIIDIHTGAAQRNNYPQIRCDFSNPQAVELAEVFDAPFIKDSKLIPKSLREAVSKKGKNIILFEGGKANRIDPFIVEEGIRGVKRVMHHLDMIDDGDEIQRGSTLLRQSKWLRAPMSGMFDLRILNGSYVEKGTIIGVISDPFGKTERSFKSPMNGYIFAVNEAPIVNKGDAIFHIGY
ncbi:M14 family metallopeptidase [Lishizhenia sp.]|uniref:succinylglutamate desuccinylase/aspartoacylase family protein n=1 Tax=Lishizhenia sp. TaxID=2497594 RepID=UPI00299E6E3A|nr:M14 family metallopeptidase [Lishizhenia sp.]MDX1445544.1 M14 family metallopeptidase [Lishizhenia sp.]